MTDKVQKISEEVERLKSQLLRGACSSQIAMETRCKEEAYDEVLSILDSMQEETVDKCNGCNNVKGCITCVDGSEWAHYEEALSKDLQEAAKWSEEEESMIRCLEGLVKDAWAKAETEHDDSTVKKMSNIAFFLKTIKPWKK